MKLLVSLFVGIFLVLTGMFAGYHYGNKSSSVFDCGSTDIVSGDPGNNIVVKTNSETLYYQVVPVKVIEVSNWTIPLHEIGQIAKFVFNDPISGFYVLLDKDNVVKIKHIDFDPKKHDWQIKSSPYPTDEPKLNKDPILYD